MTLTEHDYLNIWHTITSQRLISFHLSETLIYPFNVIKKPITEKFPSVTWALIFSIFLQKSDRYVIFFLFVNFDGIDGAVYF